ncbi:MAG TPA: hypothetical protein VGG20_25675 [Thermoanaerobaculia bacterium]|jgi:hypothetical protein
MKNLLKLSALLGLVMAASLTGGSRPAFAYASCASINGTPCTPIATQPCSLPDGTEERCVCTLAHVWYCKIP